MTGHYPGRSCNNEDTKGNHWEELKQRHHKLLHLGGTPTGDHHCLWRPQSRGNDLGKYKAEALIQLPKYSKRNFYKVVLIPVPKIVKGIEIEMFTFMFCLSLPFYRKHIYNLVCLRRLSISAEVITPREKSQC